MRDRHPSTIAGIRRLGERVSAAIPPARSTLIGALVWGCAMAISLLVGIEISSAGITNHRPMLFLLFFAGGAVSFPLSFYLTRLLTLGQSAEARFCAAFAALTVSTIAITAVLFAIVFWNTSFDWNEERFTRRWLYHLTFAGATVVYQFAVIGIRHYLPLGLILLFPASLWLARATR